MVGMTPPPRFCGPYRSPKPKASKKTTTRPLNRKQQNKRWYGNFLVLPCMSMWIVPKMHWSSGKLTKPFVKQHFGRLPAAHAFPERVFGRCRGARARLPSHVPTLARRSTHAAPSRQSGAKNMRQSRKARRTIISSRGSSSQKTPAEARSSGPRMQTGPAAPSGM